MADEKTEKAPDEKAPEEGLVDETVAAQISNWEFMDEVPTRDRVLELLSTLPAVFGVDTIDYADYVQGLPARKKIERKRTNPQTGQHYIEDEWHESYAIYMSVAGRVKMAEEIARINSWTLDFEPEPVTPTGVPGMIQIGDGRIVYREYAVFTQGRAGAVLIDDGGTYEMFEPGTRVGRKPGMAWVPYSGGKQAAGSNPYEKVETSARGRALGAWGIGVLPGSGIASLEEMLGVNQNRAAMEAAAGGGQQQGGEGRASREELIEQALTLAERLRQARRLTEEEMQDRIGAYLHDKLGVRSVYDVEAHVVDWTKVKDGQVQLLANSFADSLRTIEAQENPL